MAFLTLLSEATNWTHHASIREGLLDLVPSLKLVNDGGREVGLPDGRLPTLDMHKDAPLPSVDGNCWLGLQVEGDCHLSHTRTPADAAFRWRALRAPSSVASTTLKPGDLLIHPRQRPYHTEGSKRALTGALALESKGKRLWSSPARVRARASARPSPRRVVGGWPDVLSFQGFVRR